MKTKHKKMLKPAKELLLAYFSDGKKRKPSDFDRDILGGTDFNILYYQPPRWNNTIFIIALTELINEGLVVFELNKKDEAVYYLNK
jgi:hypothetical protein